MISSYREITREEKAWPSMAGNDGAIGRDFIHFVLQDAGT